LAGRFLDRRPEVGRFHHAMLIDLDVAVECSPKELVAQFEPQLMQNAAALGIGMGVEHDVGVVVAVVDDRAADRFVLGKVATGFVAPLPCRLIPPQILLGPQCGEIGGEAFIEPQFAPILAGDDVAPPLMRELVGDQVVAGNVQVRLVVVQRAEIERGGRGVFHPSPGILVDADLRVLRPWVAVADLAGKERHHLRRAFERGPRQR